MRVHYVKNARKAKKKRTCRCGHVIQPGESYKWAEPRYGGMKYWCQDHSPKRSELTSSKLGPLYDAQDDFDVSEATSAEEISEALQSVADTAREVAEEYQEGIDNMPEGLQEGDVAQQSQEKIEALESYANELESWDPSDVEEFDEDEAREEVEKEVLQDVLTEMMDDPDAPHPPMIDTSQTAELGTAVFDVADITVEWVQEHGDEADFNSRVNALIQQKRDEWDADHGDVFEPVREEAQELVNNFEY